jgi:dGTPase
LDACVKYPWLRTTEHRKFGVYRDDEPVFSWLRAASSHPHRRCVEAQVMDWADDVAYSVHDVEDAIHSGDLTLGVLRDDHDERAALCADVAAVYSGESVTDLAAVLDELLDDPILVPLATYDGSHASLVALKRLTSVLTGRFVAAAVHATAAASDGGPVRRYGSDLLVPRRIRAECALLKGLALRYVLRRPGAQHRYQWEQEIVVELVEGLMREAPKVLDPVFRSLWFAASDDRERLRVIIDQVSSLTDPAAVAWHHRLTAGSGAR